MNKNVKWALLLAVAYGSASCSESICLAATPDLVDSPSDQMTSEATQESLLPSRLKITYFGNFYGPGLATPTRGEHPSGKKGAHQEYIPEKRIELYNAPFVGLRLNEWDQVGLVPQFSFFPAPGSSSPRTKVGNLRAVISSDQLASFERFNLAADLHLEFPTDPQEAKQNEILGIGTSQTLSSPFFNQSIGANYALRYYFFSRRYGLDHHQRDLYLAIAPWLETPFSNFLSFYVRYEFEADHLVATPYFSNRTKNFFNLVNIETSLKPAARITINSNLNLLPYLRIRTADSMSLKSTALGLEINGTFI